MGFETSKQSSKPVFQQFPGAFGSTDSGRLATRLEGMIGRGLPKSPFAQPLQQELLNPSFAPTSAAEQGLINQIFNQVGANAATRGINITPTNISSAIAPTLTNLRQQRVQNLQQAFGQDVNTALGLRQGDLGTLLELIGLAMPQIVGGQSQKGSSFGFNADLKGAAALAAV